MKHHREINKADFVIAVKNDLAGAGGDRTYCGRIDKQGTPVCGCCIR